MIYDLCEDRRAVHSFAVEWIKKKCPASTITLFEMQNTQKFVPAACNKDFCACRGYIKVLRIPFLILLFIHKTQAPHLSLNTTTYFQKHRILSSSKMYFSKIFAVLGAASLFASTNAGVIQKRSLTAVEIVQNINIITTLSQSLQGPANRINILSDVLFLIGQGPFPVGLTRVD